MALRQPRLQACLHDAQTAQVDEPEQSGHDERAQGQEPARQTERRWNLDLHRRTPFVPDPVLVGGKNAESIMARTPIGMDRLAPRAGVLPTLIDAFEPIAQSPPFWNRQAQRGVCDAYLLCSDRQLQQRAGRNRTSIDIDIDIDGAHAYRRRQRIVVQAVRVITAC
ncbi:hypothetical protein BO992_14940 [Xanthomonas oryzae pv. oryzae]|nr:hypothetical protein BO992_14940 [Xanthomonas oryzae pv. oryzae]